MKISIKKFAVRVFIIICLCVVIPLVVLSVYISRSMEGFIQDQMSEHVFQNISRNEKNIYDNLMKLAYCSNGIVFDEELQKQIKDSESSHYRTTSYFQSLVSKIALSSTDKVLESAKVIVFDNFGRVYSNWGMNYRDYYFLLDEEWVKEASEGEGYIVWSMFNPAYIVGDEDDRQYISLARAIPDLVVAGKQLGTLILSIDRSEFDRLMMEYADENDMAFICTNGGQTLMKSDSSDTVTDEVMREIYLQTEEEKRGRIQENIGGTEYLISYYTLRKPWQFNGQDMKFFYFTDYQDILAQMSQLMSKIRLFAIVSLVLILVVLVLVVRLMVKPVVDLTQQINEYTVDKEIKGLDTERQDEIGDLNRAFCKMAENLTEAFHRLKREQEIQEHYRYEAMRAQLNPHFLFNTLTSIRFMAVIRGANNIVESIDALGGLLKYSFGRDKDQVPVREELENVREYIYIQNLRYGDHVRLEADVPDEIQELQIIKFIFQPVVENAIVHGYDSRRQKELNIRIYGSIEDGKLNMYVEDDGVGIRQDVIEEFENMHTGTKGRRLTGIGLYNVDKCIRIIFGEEYGLKPGRTEKKGTVVRFILPVIHANPGSGGSYEKADGRG